VATTYPDSTIQGVVGHEWWKQDKRSAGPLSRGRLVWVTVPFPDLKPFRLVPLGRGDDPKQHQSGHYRIEEYRVADPPPKTGALPVAGLPLREDETYLVRRGKRRPALVVALSGIPVGEELRRSAAAWQHKPAVLVAPFYGAASDDKRAGWDKRFVGRIQCGEYCQYAWDVLPMTGKDSIMRFDHVFPVGGDAANWDDTGFQLTDVAMSVIDEWFSWHLTGTLVDGAFHTARSLLLEMPSA
jgi:hypothetical protein